MSDKERGYAHRVDIRAGPEQVWRAFTEAEQLQGWCSPDAEIRARKGGLFRRSVRRVTGVRGAHRCVRARPAAAF